MNADQLKYLEAAFQTGIQSAMVYAAMILALGAAIGAFVGSYLSEKAKNFATREDIERITRIVESTKGEVQSFLTHKFAGLDKRLQAHQEAYGLTRKLRATVEAQKPLLALFHRMDEWFDANALFLEQGAREAFWAAYSAARIQPMLERRREPFDIRTAEENMKIIAQAPNQILEAFGLPPLRDPTSTQHAGGA